MPKIHEDKYIFGPVKVGERGQVVIPKEARETFNIKPGDELLILGEEKKGLAIVKMDFMKNFALKILQGFGSTPENETGEE